jgi:hypothetical protein
VKIPLRVYADTSVFGGCFEEKFSEASTRFFDQVRDGTFLLVVSDVTFREPGPALQHVKSLLGTVPADYLEEVISSDESRILQADYLAAGVVGPESENDSDHIAIATIAAVDIIVSWNFKHIVHYEKIVGYEGVNTRHGYRSPRIHSPYEVIGPMKPTKGFDCVQMKRDIQQKLLEEERLLGPEEAHRRQGERVLNDPILGTFLKRLRAQEIRGATERLE